jgi:thiosulfate dehydrogenase [quinone] large subunit
MRALGLPHRHPAFRNPAAVVAFLRSPAAGPLWFVVRLYVGWQWLTAGWHKLYGASSIGWVHDGEVGGRVLHGGDKILAFWRHAVEPPPPGAVPQVGYPWYRAFLQYLIDHHWNGWFAYVIAYGEFLVGLALLLGAFTAVAAFCGATMNFNYMLAGSASLNPVLFSGALLLILAWRTAGYVGMDRWLLPLVGTPWQPGRLLQRTPTTGARAHPVPVPPKRRLVPQPHHPMLPYARRHRRSA